MGTFHYSLYVSPTGVSGAGVTYTALSGCVLRRQPPGAEGRDPGARRSQLSRPSAAVEHEENGGV